jgi:rhodanese-related sulfurtransferase
MKSRIAVLGAGLIAVLAFGAGNGADRSQIMAGVKAQKEAALKVVGNHFIDVATLKKWMKEDKDFTILDVREPDEFKAGHIDYIETESVPRGVLYAAVKSGRLKPNHTYVVVCRTGHRALLAAATLMKWYHFKKVYVLKGGIKSWIKNGGTVENSLNLGPLKIQLLP